MIDEAMRQELYSNILTEDYDEIIDFYRDNPREINTTVGEGGKNILMLAVEYNKLPLVKRLLALSPEPDLSLTDEAGLDVFDLASQVGASAIYQQLEKHKAKAHKASSQVPSLPSTLDNKAILSFYARLSYKLNRVQSAEPKRLALYLKLKELLESAHALDKASAVEVFDYLMVVNSLIEILNSSSEDEVKSKLQAFFNQRDRQIRGKALDFCFYQGLVNQSLVELVNTLWQDELQTGDDIPNTPYDILMQNSLALKSVRGSVETFMDGLTLEELSIPADPQTFVRDLNGAVHRLYAKPYPDEDAIGVFPQAIGKVKAGERKREQIWFNEDMRSDLGMPLARTTVEWLANQSPAIKTLDDYLFEIEKQDKASQVRKEIMALIEGLQQGGKKGGDGTEEDAGPKSTLATAHFADWLAEYKQNFPKKYAQLMKISAPISNGKVGSEHRYETKTFEEIIFPVIYPAQALKRDKNLLCSDQNGSNLKHFMEHGKVIPQIDALDKSSVFVKPKSASDLEALEAAAVDDATGELKRTKDLAVFSDKLSIDFQPSLNLLAWLCTLTHSDYPLTYQHLEIIQKVLESPGALAVKNTLINPAVAPTGFSQALSPEVLWQAPGIVALLTIISNGAYDLAELEDLPFETLKAYITALYALDASFPISRTLLNTSLTQAISVESDERSWIQFLIDRGADCNHKVDFDDKRFPEAKVGQDIVLGATQMDYRIVERDETTIRIRQPEVSGFDEVEEKDAFGRWHRTHKPRLTYESDGKDDRLIDLRYHWHEVRLGKLEESPKKLVPSTLRQCSLMEYACVTEDTQLLKALVNKGVKINLDRLFDDQGQVFSKNMLVGVINTLADIKPTPKLSSALSLRLFKECKRLEKTELFYKLVPLGLELEHYQVTMQVTRKGNHSWYQQVQNESISLIQYALEKDNRNLIKACIDSGVILGGNAWFSKHISQAARAFYLGYLVELHSQKASSLEELERCFNDNVRALSQYQYNLPEDLSEILFKLKLIEHSLALMSSVKQRYLDFKDATNYLFQLYASVQNDETASARFNQDIAKVIIDILVVTNQTLSFKKPGAMSQAVFQQLLTSLLDELANRTQYLAKRLNHNVLQLIKHALEFKEYGAIKALVRKGLDAEQLITSLLSDNISLEQLTPLVIELCVEPDWSSEAPIVLSAELTTKIFNECFNVNAGQNPILKQPRNWHVIDNFFELFKGGNQSANHQFKFDKFSEQLVMLAHQDEAEDSLKKLFEFKPQLKLLSLNDSKSLLADALLNNKQNLIKFYLEQELMVSDDIFIKGNAKNSAISWSTILYYLELKQSQASAVHISEDIFISLVKSLLQENMATAIKLASLNKLLALKPQLSNEKLYGLLTAAMADNDRRIFESCLTNFDIEQNLNVEQVKDLAILSLTSSTSYIFDSLYSKGKLLIEKLEPDEKLALLILAISENRLNAMQMLFNSGARLENYQQLIAAKPDNLLNFIYHYATLISGAAECFDAGFTNNLADVAYVSHRTDILRVLLSCGLDPAYQYQSSSLLQLAFEKNDALLLQGLIKHGASSVEIIKALPMDKIELLPQLSLDKATEKHFCQAFTNIYNALYQTRAGLNCGPISWFRFSNSWQGKQVNFANIVDYCQKHPESRSAKTLALVIKHSDIFLNADGATVKDAELADLFKDLHKISYDSSRLSKTHVNDLVLSSLRNIQQYATENENSRSNTLLKAIGAMPQK